MKHVRNSAYFIVLGLIIFLIKYFYPLGIIHQSIWLIFAFFGAITFLSSQLVGLGTQNNQEEFVTFFMASVVLRLILSLVFFGVFVFQKTDNIQLFTINFIVLYLCILSFEIFENIRNLR